MEVLRLPRSRRDVDAAARRELVAESPRVFLGSFIVIGLLDAATWVIGGFTPVDLVVLAVIAIATWTTWRRLVSEVFLPWLWMLASLAIIAVVCMQLAEASSNSNFTYAVILTAVFPPLTLLWRPTLVGGALILVAVSATVAATWSRAGWGEITVADAILQLVVAYAGGIIVLYFRRRSLASGVRLTRRLESNALSDTLTGVLNRRGLEQRGAGLIAGRRAGDREVFALFIDVDGLKAINDTRGHDSGDFAIRAVARAAAAVVRQGDELGRWGGDEFVIIGVGGMPDPSLVQHRIRARLRDLAGDELGPIGVTVGGASGLDDLAELIAAADADMYARRAVVRGTQPVDDGDPAPR